MEISISSSKSKVLQGSLLVAGTSIGGGMLALPILTSPGGFIPSILIYISCWLFMFCTGLLFLEISTWMKKDANIVSMAEQILGKLGKYIAWGVYLFLFYCLTVAYIVGSGNLLAEFTNQQLPVYLCSLLFVLSLAPFIFYGAQAVSRLNFLLMIGLITSYFIFIGLGAPHVNPSFLLDRNWSLSLLALPVSFTAFAYQGIIPTLLTYMDHNFRKTRQTLFWGSLMPLVTYLVWQWLILGTIPGQGPHGLQEALQNGQNAVQPLKYFIDNSWIYTIGQAFAFFALVTSFFGVTLGLMDFLADGLKVQKDFQGKLCLSLLIFVPPLIIAFFYPFIFLVALDYAGGLGCAILLGLLPILMVWKGRYIQQRASTYQLSGGKLTLIGLLGFVTFELTCEAYHLLQKFL